MTYKEHDCPTCKKKKKEKDVPNGAKEYDDI